MTKAPRAKTAAKAAPAEKAAAKSAAAPRKAVTPKASAAPAPVRKIDSQPAAETRASIPAPKHEPEQGDEFQIAGIGFPAARKLAENVERIETLSQRLVSALSERPAPNPGIEAPGTDFFVTAANAWMKTMAEQPTRIIEQQVNFWGETLKHYAKAQIALAKGKLAAPEDDEQPAGRPDKRFKNPLWQSHPYFNFVKKQYEINVGALRRAAADLDLPDDVTRKRLDWMTNQIVDMMAPTNFLATNPDALEKAIETEGDSLVKGLENLVRDIEHHGGDLVVSLADREAFTVGENIGATQGRVVHRSPMFELIQFAPTTEKVHALPLLIFPPWINKFYILDLKPENSLIRWLVAQGYTLFIVSWKNPDASYADTGIEEYIAAYLEAMDKVRELTDQPKLNVVGYCIAGTTLSLTLSLLNKRRDNRINSATFFTCLTDFSHQGEFTTFLQDDFVAGIGAEVERTGLMRAALMSRTMSFLRANDLVWGPAIRSYMMGEAPPAFDLLYWNGDSTNLPGKMAMQYLRGLCQRNDFAGDGFEILGEKLHLSDVKVPLCSVACEGDHIAPWKDCWRGVAQMGSKDKTFILSESGHVAGIVNPPTKKKYGHYAGSTDYENGCETWRDASGFTEGSWWPRWDAWLGERSGRLVDARQPIDGLEAAPGMYVHERAI
ncbi:PHA/PHB synthase family protein [Paracoccus sp. (in: a-proteobacteria)]|uniref:PHA/PHB synthase family protein n=1 Tax=Paracoccus sp. TaxID=267 RepID=UPI003A85EBE1